MLKGEIPVPETISMQMNRIDRDIENPNYYYDPDAIQGYIDFCENELTLTTGEPLTLLPTFKLWAEDLFAWYYYSDEETIDAKTGRRVIRRKKNDYEIVSS